MIRTTFVQFLSVTLTFENLKIRNELELIPDHIANEYKRVTIPYLNWLCVSTRKFDRPQILRKDKTFRKVSSENEFDEFF